MPRPLWIVPLTLVAAAALAIATPRAQSIRALGLDARRTATYFIAEGTPGSRYQPADRDLARWALAAWERALGGAVRFEPAPERDALVTIRWVGAAEGQYGEMEPRLVGGRRGATVYIRPDTDALGPGIADRARTDALFRDTVVYLTCVHELGHALGLEHTDDFRDIMFFFGYGGDIPGFFGRYRDRLTRRADIANESGLSASDIARVRAVYAAK